MTDTEDTHDKPLDPAQLRLQARLTRLLIYSGGIMVLGLIAVFAAILYRVNRPEARPTLDAAKPALIDTVAIPSGSRIVDSRLDNGTIVLTLEHPGGGTVLLLDAVTLKAMRRLDLKAQ